MPTSWPARSMCFSRSRSATRRCPAAAYRRARRTAPCVPRPVREPKLPSENVGSKTGSRTSGGAPDHPLRDRRHARHPPGPTVRSRHLHLPVRPRGIRAPEQFLPDARPALPAARHPLFDGHPVHAGRTAVLRYPRGRFHEVLSTPCLLRELRSPVPGFLSVRRPRFRRGSRTSGGPAAAPPGPPGPLSPPFRVSLARRRPRPVLHSFGPSPQRVRDCFGLGRLLPAHRSASRRRRPSAGEQDTVDKARDLRPIHTSHMRPPGPDGLGHRLSGPARPPSGRLMRFALLGPERRLRLPCRHATRRGAGRSASGSYHVDPRRTSSSGSLPGRLSLSGGEAPVPALRAIPGAHGKGAGGFRRPPPGSLPQTVDYSTTVPKEMLPDWLKKPRPNGQRNSWSMRVALWPTLTNAPGAVCCTPTQAWW